VPPPFRRATAADVVALRDLERAASLAGIAHVFPADRFPFPDDGVLARWALVLEDDDVRVEVVDGPAGLRALTAYDGSSLRHLAVHPDDWGYGLGRAGVERAVEAIAAGGSAQARLWVLEHNHRARGLYEKLGWRPSGVTQECSWPPHPVETEMVLDLRGRPRPGGRDEAQP
jgi:GNAT superfamily N-acetyltransferase